VGNWRQAEDRVGIDVGAMAMRVWEEAAEYHLLHVEVF
jgi:hypothetical protein